MILTNIETVPGITSFTACAAARNEALVEQNDILSAKKIFGRFF